MKAPFLFTASLLLTVVLPGGGAGDEGTHLRLRPRPETSPFPHQVEHSHRLLI